MSGEQEKQNNAANVVTVANSSASTMPGAPDPVQPPSVTTQPPEKGAMATFDHFSRQVDAFENVSHLQPQIDPYKAKLEFMLKRDKSYDEPNSSLDTAGLTGGAKPGFRYDWTADLFAQQTWGNGPLNPGGMTRAYGGEIETHATIKEGPFSAEGRIDAQGGQEHFRAYLTKAQMDAQLAAQGVPPEYFAQAEPALAASLPQTTQPLVRGEANAYVDFDPKVTYLKKGLLELGLTRVGAGGDLFYGSLDHGVQHEVCGTGLNLGKSIAASVCEINGHGVGYDDPQVHQGLQFDLAIKPSHLPEDIKQLFKPKKVNGR